MQLSKLTTWELSTTIASCDWFTTQTQELLEPVVVAKISSLGADCRAEIESRTRSERESRRDAVAGRVDPLAHYTS